MNWKIIGRPGRFGAKRDEFFRQYDEIYGKGNWEIVWEWGRRNHLRFFGVCSQFEQSYYRDSFERQSEWLKLIGAARDVYDISPSDVVSGLDYSAQKSEANHIQDIAIRNVLKRRDWKFEGKELESIHIGMLAM